MMPKMNEKSPIPTELKDFSEYLFRPKYFFFRNLAAGFARGVGIFLGLTVGVAVVVWGVNQVVDFPLVGQYFERLLQIIEAGNTTLR